jgi:Anthrone oxygenase
LLTFLVEGNIEGLSLNSVPALSQSQKQDSVPAGYLTRQWLYIYDAGKIQNPSVAVIAGSSFSYLAWSVRSGTALSLLVPANSFRVYTTAALLTFGMIPFTAVFMLPTNNKLMAKAEQAAAAKGAVVENDKEVVELLEKWSVLSGIRGLLPLLGGVVSLAAILA